MTTARDRAVESLYEFFSPERCGTGECGFLIDKIIDAAAERARAEKETIAERYERMGDTEWFKRQYGGKSVGDYIPIEGEEPGGDTRAPGVDTAQAGVDSDVAGVDSVQLVGMPRRVDVIDEIQNQAHIVDRTICEYAADAALGLCEAARTQAIDEAVRERVEAAKITGGLLETLYLKHSISYGSVTKVRWSDFAVSLCDRLLGGDAPDCWEGA